MPKTGKEDEYGILPKLVKCDAIADCPEYVADVWYWI